jgi:hypothetical protein
VVSLLDQQRPLAAVTQAHGNSDPGRTRTDDSHVIFYVVSHNPYEREPTLANSQNL